MIPRLFAVELDCGATFFRSVMDLLVVVFKNVAFVSDLVN